jgi:2-C-methyl-D-erythritol 4-phosphate cytidylyltransferase
MATEPKFAAIVLTAPPPGLAHEAGGAYVKVDGREALLRSVELFLNRPNIIQVLLAVAPEDLATAKDRYGHHLGFAGVKLVAGGPRWMAQVAAAGPLVSAAATHVVLHDAARPIVPAVDVEAVLAAAADHPAVGLSTPVRTTTVETDDGGQPMAFQLPLNRAFLLTPQAFDRKTFDELARTRVETHASRVTLVKGSPLNVRVGTPGDAAVATAFLKLMPKPKVRAASSPFEEAQW